MAPMPPGPSPYTSTVEATHLSHTSPRPSNSNTLPSPHIDGPSSVTSPEAASSYVNGNDSQHGSRPLNTPLEHSTSVQQNVAASPLDPGFHSSALHGYASHPPATATNGQQPKQDNGIDRRNSMNLPSPLSKTPILTPRVTGNYAAFPLSSSPAVNYTPSAKFSPQSVSTPQAQMPPFEHIQDSSHASILPPATTGYSPTKHPSRQPSTSTGSFAASTPSALPPVTSLSPSPQVQNFTPPVKPSDPERKRDYGQSVGS